jgi:hypothetical protein
MSGWSSQLVVAQQVIIEGSGDVLLVYDGPAAPGNLIASIAPPAGGTDAEGNVYQGGITSQTGVTRGAYVNLLNGEIFVSGGGTRVFVAGSLIAEAGGSDSDPSIMVLSSPTDNLDVSQAQIVLQGKSKDGTVLPALLATADIEWASGALPVDAETWHPLAPQNGWVNRAGFSALQYRRVASPPRTVEVIGHLASGTNADGTLIGTLPAGYRPAGKQDVPIMGSAPGADESPTLEAGTDGTLKIFHCAGVTLLGFHFLLSLDA